MSSHDSRESTDDQAEIPYELKSLTDIITVVPEAPYTGKHRK
jgi:hypothetical protein